MTTLTFDLVGPGGEPVDLWRTLASHGMADLPPMAWDEAARSLEATLPLPASRPRTVVIRQGAAGQGTVTVSGRAPGTRQAGQILAAVQHVLRMDEDLSGFYAEIAVDPALSWAAGGAGRMVRSPTVFEDVVKTICTTNCTWSATVRMASALVEHLGEPAAAAPANGWRGRAFPTPAAMAEAGEDFYRGVARTGYRGAYLMALARSVAGGELDLEAWGRASPQELPDDELASRLLALPGVGPYAAAHIMMTMGRYSRLILDSWTRPTYARLAGRRTVKDTTIERRFRRYGRYAGLAFWLFVTSDWVAEP
jgi:N-glycosylase/DNA lyase